MHGPAGQVEAARAEVLAQCSRLEVEARAMVAEEALESREARLLKRIKELAVSRSELRLAVALWREAAAIVIAEQAMVVLGPREGETEVRLISPRGEHWTNEGGSHEKLFADTDEGWRGMMLFSLNGSRDRCCAETPCMDLEVCDEGDHISGRLDVARCSYATGDEQ